MNKFKKVIVGLISVIFIVVPILFFSAHDADAATRVRGYIRSNGTYVTPHYRSTPNRTQFDNWSTKGNYNPYTGKKGTKIIRYR